MMTDAISGIDFRSLLGRRLGIREIRRICDWCAGVDGDGHKSQLLALVGDADDRVGYNALWVCTHFAGDDRAWLRSWRHMLIDRLLVVRHVGQRRLILNLLNGMETCADDLRTDYLDYCLAGINSTGPYGVRALCLKQAFAQCRHYPELLAELTSQIDLMESGPLSPGLISVRRKIRHAILNIRT